MSSSADNLEISFTISSDHPSLPGHFPGNPIVPGVVILDHVIQRLQLQLWQQQHKHRITQIMNSKFIRILKAETPCIIHYEVKQNQRIAFTVIDSCSNEMDSKKNIICKGLLGYE